VTYKRVFGLGDWIYWHLQAITALSLIYTLYNSPLHTRALVFSDFTSRILATAFITVSLSLQMTHEVFLALPNSCHYSATANSVQFYASKLIFRQAAVSKLD
jgi:hypothetical protein